MAKEVRTRHQPENGIEEYDSNIPHPGAQNSAFLNPPFEEPQKNRREYAPPAWSIEKLKTLEESEIKLLSQGNYTKEDLRTWSTSDFGTVWTIVNTVQASSRIEDEGVLVSQVPVIFHAITKTDREPSEELTDRQAAMLDISKAYFWALSSPRDPILSVEFILELHDRMFKNTRPEIAGHFKTGKVIISDDSAKIYNVETLPYPRARKFLHNACIRTCEALKNPNDLPNHSHIVIIAEFILDFLAIHPFQDGNGRTARLLSTYLLESCGYYFTRFYPFDQIILEKRNEYFEALFKSQITWYSKNENLSKWIDFYVAAVFRQWERAFSEIRDNRVLKDANFVPPLVDS